MSVVANFIGSLQKPRYNASLTTGPTTVYTVSDGNKMETLGAFSFANKNGSAVDCELYHYDGTTAWLVWVGNVANKTTAIIESDPVRLRPGDEIRAVANTGVTVKLSIISQLETGTL